jgi:CPA2 family monovalent cation:H+ antiporter-2
MLETGLKSLAAAAIFLWLFALLPAEGNARWVLVGSVAVALAALAVLWRKLVFWHSQLEVELKEVITSAEGKMTATSAPWLQAHGDWHLHMIDCVLPDLADAQGRKIAELDLRAKFGCSVVGIERQGFMIPLPPPDAVLYPRDRVLLMGTTEQVKAGKKFLGAVSGVADSLYEELLMESITLPMNSRAAGQTLAELAPARVHGVQVAGVNRRGLRILNPSADERLQVGDEILVLGAPAQIREFKIWVHQAPDDSPALGD